MREELRDEIISWLKAIVIALAIVFVVRSFIVTPSMVKGHSMQPNLSDGDRIIISKMSSFDRLDVIAFHAPAPNQADNYVKRIIGMPGDRIEIENGLLFIDDEFYGEILSDEFRVLGLTEEEILSDVFMLEESNNHRVVPEGTYFVMGDNRNHSFDSRQFGVIHEDSIIGEVVFRFWPLDSIGRFTP